MTGPRKTSEVEPGILSDGLLTWCRSGEVFSFGFGHFPEQHQARIQAEFDAWLRSGVAGAQFAEFVKLGKPDCAQRPELRVA